MQSKASLILERLTNYRRFSSTRGLALLGQDVVSFGCRRYFRGIYNLTNKFAGLCDYWIVINNSGRPFTFVAEGQGATEIRVHDEMVWKQIKIQPDEKE